MKYQSKKDPTITAAFDFQNEKTKTITMIYLTGEKAGHSFDISASTLKRWWKKMDATEEEVAEERINAPYHPDVTPHYIPKPQSVIDYENAKSTKRSNIDLPSFEDMVDTLQSVCKKVNETSKYVQLLDSDTTIWRKSRSIDIYADEQIWTKLAESGLQSTANKDKKRPFAIKITSAEDYETLVNTLIQ
jgi:hypothetical protein